MKRAQPSPSADVSSRLRRWGIFCLCVLWWGVGVAASCPAADGRTFSVPPAGALSLPRLLPAAPGAAQECGDLLRAADIQPAGLEFLFCRREGQSGRQRLTARYRVRGSEAAAVEQVLRERCSMGALVRSAGIWSLPDGEEGRLDPSALRVSLPEGTAPSEAGARVSMGEVPQSGVFAPDRAAWPHIAWFAVRVDLPLDAPAQD